MDTAFYSHTVFIQHTATKLTGEEEIQPRGVFLRDPDLDFFLLLVKKRGAEPAPLPCD
jgi:hypothetical protein